MAFHSFLSVFTAQNIYISMTYSGYFKLSDIEDGLLLAQANIVQEKLLNNAQVCSYILSLNTYVWNFSIKSSLKILNPEYVFFPNNEQKICRFVATFFNTHLYLQKGMYLYMYRGDLSPKSHQYLH